MKVKFDSKQFGKVLFIVYCLLLIPLIGLLVKTFNDLDQLVMNPGFTESEKLRSDFPKLIFVIGFIFIIGITSSLSFLFYIRRNKHTLDFENFSIDETNNDIALESKEEFEEEEKLTLIQKLQTESFFNKEIIEYQELLNTVCKHLSAGLGIIYLTNKESETEYLEFKYGYAIHKPNNNSNKILIGEGLTGQAAASEKTILIKNISDNHVTIYSGLGASSPKSLLITPIIKNNEVLGVIEIASFNNFNYQTQTELEEVVKFITTKKMS